MKEEIKEIIKKNEKELKKGGEKQKNNMGFNMWEMLKDLVALLDSPHVALRHPGSTDDEIKKEIYKRIYGIFCRCEISFKEPDFPTSKQGIFYQRREIPNRPIKIVVFDDMDFGLSETGMNLAGWKNIQLELVQLNYRKISKQLGEMPLKEVIEKLAEELLEEDPDIVLMDQSLYYGYHGVQILGSQIVPILNHQTVVVGNSGCDPENLLEREGALKNIAKGRSLRGLNRAIKYLNRPKK